MDSLTAISPVDGRYASKCESLRPILSEFGLMRNRVYVEVSWLIHIGSGRYNISGIPTLSASQVESLQSIHTLFGLEEARIVKRIEECTNHDVKAVEYFLRDCILKDPSLAALSELVHFCCTSEDINNLSYALMLSQYHSQVLLPKLISLVAALSNLVAASAAVPLLAMTHGQPATPTTFGKEVSIYVNRLRSQIERLETQKFFGKFNGASGNFNAHTVAYPGIDWETVADEFVSEKLGLTYQGYSTQIESHDFISELADDIARSNTILIDMCRDMWLYISRGVLK